MVNEVKLFQLNVFPMRWFFFALCILSWKVKRVKRNFDFERLKMQARVSANEVWLVSLHPLFETYRKTTRKNFNEKQDKKFNVTEIVETFPMAEMECAPSIRSIPYHLVDYEKCIMSYVLCTYIRIVYIHIPLFG